jgi:hypothetical protein
MRLPLKLSSIDQEHLQELYDASGVSRDELPYTDKFEEIWQGFQDRTFKNAERDQVFGALLKYVRSSSNAATDLPETTLTEDQAKQLKILLPRHARGAKMLPYSDEFDAARKEFNHLAKAELDEKQFWHAIVRAQGARRTPPKRAAKKVKAVAGDDDDVE